MSPEEMLAHILSFKTVVGQPNGDLVASLKDYLEGHGATCTVIPGPEGDRSNLFATLGPKDVPGYVLSGHLDVVPAGEPEWLGDPFVLRRNGEKLIGRGACDMKGFVAAILAAVPDLAAMDLKRPVHFALSYDEEAGCRGVPHMIAKLPDLCATPLGCIVGEPTNMTPVLRHKGKVTMKVSARGVPGHSSRTDMGRNAIHMLVPALAAAAQTAEDLKTAAQDEKFEPPYSTMQVGTVGGGLAVNIIPDRAEALIEARAIPGVDPLDLFAPLKAAAPELTFEAISAYPALSTEESHPLAALLEGLSGKTPLTAVSYGTEAGLFQAAGVPSIVCGPGDISRAHKPEEYITVGELDAAYHLALDLGRKLEG
ncbi:acetylornithine deacetylase [Pseudooceanicola nanhaiensis]|uniref:acetylornithine deacetylase n=1 Tax=Pseudooceanicola nanhaiensis TaxID=375761 RepID=UPI001CD28AF6|nr:acetylornithine deacetylase [Pseudooceanicola nanhaiensis]MCA0920834.1 acetylornithine deacetylase [Pseudooceanicola nanhaiensis]